MSVFPRTAASSFGDRMQALTNLQFRTASAISLLDGLGLGLIIPLLPFLLLELGGTPATITLLVAIYSLAGVIGAPLLGRLSDRLGRPRLIGLALMGSAVSYAGIMLGGSLFAVYVFRALGGLMSGRTAVLRALVTDAATGDQQVRAIGWISSASLIGTTLGPIVTSIVALLVFQPQDQLVVTMGLAMVLTALGLVALKFAWPQTSLAAASSRTATRTKGDLRPIWLPLLLSGVASYGHGVIMSVTALFVHVRFGWGVYETGWLLAVIAAGTALARVAVMPALVRFAGVERSLLLCLAVGAPSLAAMGSSKTVVAYIAATAVFSLANGLGNVLPAAAIAKRASPASRGYAMGVGQSLGALGLFLSAASSGLWFQLASPAAPFLLGGVVLATGALILMANILARRVSPEQA